MAVYLTKEKTEEIFKEYGGSGKEYRKYRRPNCIGLLTVSTNYLNIFKETKKTTHVVALCCHWLEKESVCWDIWRRRDITKYRELIDKLGLRK